MANRGRATFAKRQKEIARQERAREKAAKRVERKETWVKLDRKAAPRRIPTSRASSRARSPCPTTSSKRRSPSAEKKPTP